MKKDIVLAFRLKWKKVLKLLPKQIAREVKRRIKKGELDNYLDSDTPWVAFDPEDELLDIFLQEFKDRTIEGGIKILEEIRERIEIEKTDIRDEEIYRLWVYGVGSSDLLIRGKDTDYFDLESDCEGCDRFKWIQVRDIELRNRLKGDIDEVMEGELIISDRLKNLLEEANLEGLVFRPVKSPVGRIWQLTSEGQAIVRYPDQNIVEKYICKVCGRGRELVLDESNGVDMGNPPPDKTRISRYPPTVNVVEMHGDIARSNIELGLVGYRFEKPEPPWLQFVVPTGENYPSYIRKQSHPLWIVTGRFCKVLYEARVKGFDLEPARLVSKLSTDDQTLIVPSTQ